MALADMQSAVRMRSVIEQMASVEIKKLRPPERIGSVYSVDPSRQVASILFAGETLDGLVEVHCAADKIPTRTMIETFNEEGYSAAGDIVRVAGNPGGYYVLDFIKGAPKASPMVQTAINRNMEVIDTRFEEVNVDLVNLNDVVLPQLRTDLESLNVTLQSIEPLISTHQQDLEELQQVTLPNLTANLQDANDRLGNIETVIIPDIVTDVNYMNDELIPDLVSSVGLVDGRLSTVEPLVSGHQNMLNTLNTTTIPAITSSVSAHQQELDNLNENVIPGIRSGVSIMDGVLEVRKFKTLTHQLY